MKDWNSITSEDFRQEVRAFLRAHYPPELRYPTRRLRWHEIRDWYLTLSRHGWLAPSWPVDYGGMGLSPEKLVILMEEQEGISFLLVDCKSPGIAIRAIRNIAGEVETAGSAGAIRAAGTAGDAVDALSAFYSARSATIYGGTSEIQRNIIARSVLGLRD